MSWLTDPSRIPFYIGIRVARSVVSPFFYTAAAVLVKRFIIGKFQAGPRDVSSQVQLLRHWLAARLLSRKGFQDIADIVGRHYEIMSMVYRACGARVGKRVFWPGRQPVTTGELDLLDVGDDVVFGSRSSLIFTSMDKASKITLGAGANVADNCIVLPGGMLGKNAVLASNSICPQDRYLPSGSVWFGSKGSQPQLLEKGEEEDSAELTQHSSSPNDFVPPKAASSSKLQKEGSQSTLRPFGKAVYEQEPKNLPYTVLPPSVMMILCVAIKFAISCFHTLPILAALHTAAAILWGTPASERDYSFSGNGYTFGTLYVTFLGCFIVFHAVRILLTLLVELTAKRCLIGRRRKGAYNYDSHSYPQRWEIYQLICKIRQFNGMNYLEYFSGSAWINQYFRWNGAKIGKDVCLYPSGADPYMPEPDLVTIEDHAVIDAASIVCHLNTKGNFTLSPIHLGKGCTLRSQSRVQQAVQVGEGAMLLQKSLAMTGEVLEEFTIWQGCPASFWKEYPATVRDTGGGTEEKTPTPSNGSKSLLSSSSSYSQSEGTPDLSTKTSRNV